MDGSSHLLVSARLPTLHGAFRILAFDSGNALMPHLALVSREVSGDEPVHVRVHSECLTGDVFGSTRCDCGEQLSGALDYIGGLGGVLIYLRQEGRGIGLVNKLKAYNLQDEGMDTFEANHALGFGSDERVYPAAIAILLQLGIRRIHLITNNPEKIAALDSAGIEVVSRIPIVIPPRPENVDYLEAKKSLRGHLLHP